MSKNRENLKLFLLYSVLITVAGLSAAGKTHPETLKSLRIIIACGSTQALCVCSSVTRQLSVWLTRIKETCAGAICERVRSR